jgi:hypothetical protein
LGRVPGVVLRRSAQRRLSLFPPKKGIEMRRVRFARQQRSQLGQARGTLVVGGGEGQSGARFPLCLGIQARRSGGGSRRVLHAGLLLRDQLAQQPRPFGLLGRTPLTPCLRK